jgi:hypothetical protein
MILEQETFEKKITSVRNTPDDLFRIMNERIDNNFLMENEPSKRKDALTLLLYPVERKFKMNVKVFDGRINYLSLSRISKRRSPA